MSSIPVELDVPNAMEPVQICNAAVGEGLRSLYERSELCDVALSACGERFMAHKAMLAAMSVNFRKYLQHMERGSEGATKETEMLEGLLVPLAEGSKAEAGPDDSTPTAVEAPAAQSLEGEPSAEGAAAVPVPAKAAGPRCLELQVTGLKTAEAVRILLDYLYGVSTATPFEYAPSSPEVNKDMLRLARHFGLPHLHEHAARWLAKGLTTANVVLRLVTCDEFGLGMLRDRIIERLIANPSELAVVCTSIEVIQHPKILQELLIQVASLCGAAGVAKEQAQTPPTSGPSSGAPRRRSISKEKTEEQEKLEKAAAEEQTASAKQEQRPPKKAKRGAASA